MKWTQKYQIRVFISSEEHQCVSSLSKVETACFSGKQNTRIGLHERANVSAELFNGNMVLNTC